MWLIKRSPIVRLWTYWLQVTRYCDKCEENEHWFFTRVPYSVDGSAPGTTLKYGQPFELELVGDTGNDPVCCKYSDTRSRLCSLVHFDIESTCSLARGSYSAYWRPTTGSPGRPQRRRVTSAWMRCVAVRRRQRRAAERRRRRGRARSQRTSRWRTRTRNGEWNTVRSKNYGYLCFFISE